MARAMILAFAALVLPLCLGLVLPRAGNRQLNSLVPKRRLGVLTGISRRQFGGLSLGAVFFAPKASSAAAPAGVLGSWDLRQNLQQTGVTGLASATLTFDRSGEATVRSGDAVFFSVSDWKVSPMQRYLRDTGSKVSFTIEFASETLAYTGLLEDSAATVMTGTVAADGADPKMAAAGTFTATLVAAADFAKKRSAFAKYDNPNAPVLELNGRPRWQVERERDGLRLARPTTPAEEAAQSKIYFSLSPADLQGYSYAPE
jgi:hypothetical protein